MAQWHGYFAIQDIALTAEQRSTLWRALQAWGQRNASNKPHERMHYRTNNDNSAVIFEAFFDTDNLTVNHSKNVIANIFSVDANIIDHALTQATFESNPTPIVTFSAGGTDRLRMALFGGVGADWDASRREGNAYIAANRAQWESEVV